MTMRILYIGQFEKNHRTEVYVTYAFWSLGAEVIQVDVKSATYSFCKKIVSESNIDFVLISKASHRETPMFLEWCKTNGIFTVCWLWDLYWGFRRHTRFPAGFACDLVCTTDGGHDEQWEKAGINHSVVRQGIHATDHVMYDADYRYDVAFVGSVYVGSDRAGLVNTLRRHYGNRFIWHRRTRGLDLNRALSEVKVVVGYDYGVKNYWSNRIYEILGRGGFLLHPETVGLSEEFTAGVHYAACPHLVRGKDFKSVKIKQAIDYWVSQDVARESIRLSGWRRCGQYTYRSRVVELLREVDRRHGIGSYELVQPVLV
jgi:hypothetical protein